MITQQNIKAFINFLYNKKFGTEAPQELLEKWNNLSSSECTTQLDFLFESWSYNYVQKQQTISDFLKQEKVKIQAANTVEISTKPLPKNTSNVAKNSLQKWLKTGLKIGLFLASIIALFLVYKYYQFTHLHSVYTITESVVIRDEYGEKVGTLDLQANGKSDSYQSLFAIDNDVYSRPIDSTNKLYEHRKVLLKNTDFWAFCANNSDIYGYVNAKFVIDSKEEYELYKRLFGHLEPEDNKRLQLVHRKVIANCLKQSSHQKNAYILSACNNCSKAVRKNNASILTHELIANNKYEIVAKMSDGFYYHFIGDVLSEQYENPRKIGYVENPNRPDEFLSGDVFFRYMPKSKTYHLSNCNGKLLPFKSVHNTAGEILFFEQEIIKQDIFHPLEEFKENAEDVLQNVGDVLEELVN